MCALISQELLYRVEAGNKSGSGSSPAWLINVLNKLKYHFDVKCHPLQKSQ